MIEYISGESFELQEQQLMGFFQGWPNPPDPKTHIKILKNSYRAILAIEDQRVIGCITAISDGVLCAYIPLLEVLPQYKSLGIGSELVRLMKIELQHLYMVDLLCDESLIPFYEKLGMTKASGACLRNYGSQKGYS